MSHYLNPSSLTLSTKNDCHELAPAGNKEPHDRSLTPPPPQWDGEGNQKKKVKLVGWSKDSLIGQKMKKENNNNNTNKRTHKTSDAQFSFLTTWKPDAQPGPEQ